MNRWTIAVSALILALVSSSVPGEIKPGLVEQARENGRLSKNQLPDGIPVSLSAQKQSGISYKIPLNQWLNGSELH